jgi:hypothetical protein
MSDDSEEAPRSHTRRKRTTQDWVTTTGGVIAITASLGTAIAWAQDQLPFVKNSTYEQRSKDVDSRLNDLSDKVNGLMTGQSSIQRTGLLSLELQLQQRVDSISEAIVKLTAGSTEHSTLVQTRAGFQQQLREVSRQLGK